MRPVLKTYIAGLVISSAVALGFTSFVFRMDGIALPLPTNNKGLELFAGLAFWTVLALVTSALPVRMPRGILIAVSIAPIIGATSLGGPAAGGWVALIGTTEVRELRGRIPWYGTLANHAGIVIPAIVCGLVIERFPNRADSLPTHLVATLVGAAFYVALNLA